MKKIIAETFKILKIVILKHGYCNVMIAKMMQNPKFTINEKRQIEKYVNSTLKHQIYLDYLFNNFLKNLQFIEKDKVVIELKILSWLLLYHFYFNKVADYSSETAIFLDLALLLNDKMLLIGKILAYLELYPNTEFNLAAEKPHVKKLIKYSYPEWIYNLVAQEFSSECANNLVNDNINDAVISFRVNLLKTEVATVLEAEYYRDYHFQMSKLVPDGIISEQEIFTTELYQTGKIIKQDQASMKIAHILTPKPTDLIWDMCGGIGSKTAHIAALTNNQAQIYMTEIDANLIAITLKMFSKLGVKNVKAELKNALKVKSKKIFDKILLDAPNTAFGLIKRKPELKLISWSQVAINELLATQKALLKKAYQALKPNGILLYTTCTFNMLENQIQIQKFLKKFPDMVIIEEQQSFGYEAKTDGFYFCKLQKSENNNNEN